jgi:hypothetical protein
VDGARRLPGVLASTNPQVLLLLAGANDIEALRTPAAVTDGLNGLLTMVRTARQRGIAVFVGTLPPVRPGGRLSLPTALVQTFNDGVRARAASKGGAGGPHAAWRRMRRTHRLGGLHPTKRVTSAWPRRSSPPSTTYEGR